MAKFKPGDTLIDLRDKEFIYIVKVTTRRNYNDTYIIGFNINGDKRGHLQFSQGYIEDIYQLATRLMVLLYE